jgi:hypothetical protein
MKIRYEHDETGIIRSGARLRESVRCLPRGQFQQIRRMFDEKQSRNSLRTMSINNNEQQRQTTYIDDIDIGHDRSFEEYYRLCQINNDINMKRYIAGTDQICCENKTKKGKYDLSFSTNRNHPIECHRHVLS